jgi:hypothetical protein
MKAFLPEPPNQSVERSLRGDFAIETSPCSV